MSKKRRKKKKLRVRWNRIFVALFVVIALLFGIYKSFTFVIGEFVNFFQSDNVIEVETEKPSEAIGTVVLDPGHGGVDVGAVRGNLYEKDIDLKVAQIVQTELEEHNVNVVMTRETDETINPHNKISDLKQRAGMSQKYQADYFVSIHVNAFDQTNDISGFEVYVRNDESQTLAKNISTQIESLNLSQNRGIVSGKHLQVLRDNTVPSVLIELGYINGKDYAYLSNDAELERLAKSIAKGILKMYEKIN